MTSIDAILPLAVVALVIGVALLRWPEAGTLMAVAILYLNLLPIAIRYHNVSPLFAAATPALVIPALVKHWALDRGRLVIDRPLLLMCVFLACSIISSLFSKSIDLSVPWIARYVTQGMLVYLLLINLIRSRGALRRVTWVLVLCGGLLASLTVYQEATGTYTNEFGGLATRRSVHGQHIVKGPAAAPVTKSMRRAHGPDLDANRYAQILIVLLPLAWCLMRTEAEPWAVAGAAACSSLILGGVLLTYSRGAFLGLLAMLGLMGVLRVLSVRRALLACAAAVIIAAVLSPGYVDRIVTLRGIEGLFDPATESEVELELDPVARTRATILVVAWRVFVDHPIVGVGPDQFAAVYVVEYLDRHFATHSLYLQLAAEMGLVGLSVFIWIVIGSLTRLRMVWRRTVIGDRFLANWAAAAFVAISAYMVTGLFLHLTYQRYFWLMLGLGGATVQLWQAARGKDVETLGSLGGSAPASGHSGEPRATIRTRGAG